MTTINKMLSVVKFTSALLISLLTSTKLCNWAPGFVWSNGRRRCSFNEPLFWWTSFQVTVRSNYAIAIATLSDWLAPVFQPMTKKTKTSRPLRARFFPRFVVTGNCNHYQLRYPAMEIYIYAVDKAVHHNRGLNALFRNTALLILSCFFPKDKRA